MLTSAFSSFWQFSPTDETASAPPRKRPGPIFIGDAVQPWRRETLLLEILRRDSVQEYEQD